MKYATSSRAPVLSRVGLFAGAIAATAIFANTTVATTVMTRHQLPAAFPGYDVHGKSSTSEFSVNDLADAIYDRALKYMLKHPPRVYGHGARVDAENRRLTKENSQFYERMGRFELVMNNLAAKCSEVNPAHAADCDGRAMLRLHQIQQQQGHSRDS